jgi:hypothetical protein
MAGVYGQAPNFINGDPLGDRHLCHSNLGLFEVDGYFIRGDWTLQGQLSYGYQKAAAITPDINGNCRRPPGTACRRWQPTSSRRGSKASGASTSSTTRATVAACSATASTPATASAPTATWAAIRRPVSFRLAARRVRTATRCRVGMNYVFNEYTMFKVEARYDWSNLPVFLYVDDSSYRKSNTVLGASVVVSF